jgi:hypothetical protein
MNGTSTRTAEGGCHCGAVRFSVEFTAPPQLLDCNCSICAKTGYLHLIASEEDFTLLSGGGDLTEYSFGSGTAKHLFCRHCGIKSFYVPRSHPDGYSVNWRALDDVGDIVPAVAPYEGRGDWEQARAALGDKRR